MHAVILIYGPAALIMNRNSIGLTHGARQTIPMQCCDLPACIRHNPTIPCKQGVCTVGSSGVQDRQIMWNIRPIEWHARASKHCSAPYARVAAAGRKAIMCTTAPHHLLWGWTYSSRTGYSGIHGQWARVSVMHERANTALHSSLLCIS